MARRPHVLRGVAIGAYQADRRLAERVAMPPVVLYNAAMPTKRVDLHCHSSFSDGQLAPEELAARLAAAGVAFAALTDHDDVAGLSQFRAAASRRGIGCIGGLELTVQCDGREAHLLAYGFDATNAELLATIRSLQQTRKNAPHLSDGVDGISQSLRLQRLKSATEAAGPSAAPEGRLDIADAIALIHRCAGKAFLAHPLLLENGLARLEELLGALKKRGLDGVEAIYASFSPADRQALVEMAARLGLLICGGADQHLASPAAGAVAFGVDMPTAAWRAFRGAVASGPAPTAPSPASPLPAILPRRHLRRFALHIILPTVLAITLFVTGIFAIALPTLERVLLDRKREMILELTNSAWSMLDDAHREEARGHLTRQAAQAMAVARIEAMRYGREAKGYFWLQDMHPRIVMHPYRQDLNGRDVSDFTDARGAKIFVEFADLVRRKQHGYVEYVWQWNDDPRHLAAKESYIRGFEPWGWIIGTGVYAQDVHEEIARMEQRLVYGSIAIAIITAMLLFYVMRHGLRIERQRAESRQHLHETSERYRWLVEAVTEGTLLVLGGRCRYANPMLLEMLGYAAHELELLDLVDLLGDAAASPEAWQAIAHVQHGAAAVGPIQTTLSRRDNSPLPCLVSIKPLVAGDESGLVLLARPLSKSAARQRPIDRIVPSPPDTTGDIVGQISAANDETTLVSACRHGSGKVAAMLDAGTHPRHIARQVAAVCDAATRRLIGLAQADLGPAPAAFAFIALGSQGRQEQTLCTDQDNGIVYADDPAGGTGAADYFEQLGRRVCDGLAHAGYERCRGEVMADNPKWRQPLETWKSYFTRWIVRAEPRELLDFNIFFDFRAVAGDASLVESLLRHVQQSVAAAPDFFPHFAQHALLFRPPLGLFGRIVTSKADGDAAGLLDLKAAMMPVVSFARLYALRHRVAATGTLDRLAALVDAAVIPETTFRETQAAYESMMRLRLRHQCDAAASGSPVNNLIDPDALGHIERAVLKESFTEIEAVQRRVSYDFLGGPAA
ncbi:MAG: DUF294 nucleotidyltransferase-like domain-containing protein [Planctomycetaceae bacterium]|nr:DUF294 nucleotidyltransferase-like domain-containing protein [Planctomycetaceae bacterium]